MHTLKELLKQGLLGFYNQAEITEVFACLPDGRVANIFTICVVEENPSETFVPKGILNTKRIRLSGLKGWSFGVQRYGLSLSGLETATSSLTQENRWAASGKSLGISPLVPCSSIFVPPDTYEHVPLNGLLKNNFFNGSYVFEWFDEVKEFVQPLLNAPPLLQTLSEEIQRYVPLKLASVSDRLGNIIVQIPAQTVLFKLRKCGTSDNMEAQLTWHAKAPKRSLRLVCSQEDDQILRGFSNFAIAGDEVTKIPLNYQDMPSKAMLWDDDNQVLLAASGSTSFLMQLSLNTYVGSRAFRYFTNPYTGQEERIPLSSTRDVSKVGYSPIPRQEAVKARIYEAEQAKLLKDRFFIQYPLEGKLGNEAHEAALGDIRGLIHSYGEAGVWLWDPYLSPKDIVKTLFYSQYYGADLRALTDLATVGGLSKTETLKEYQNAFEELNSNFEGLSIEFRARITTNAPAFHDRFLIFPASHGRRMQAWSLGCSVNHIGREHHILQKVDHAQMIGDAFLKLWDQLDQPKHLIWKRS